MSWHTIKGRLNGLTWQELALAGGAVMLLAVVLVSRKAQGAREARRAEIAALDDVARTKLAEERKAQRKLRRNRLISLLINIAALIATSVQAGGMWRFFGTTMGLPVGFRIFMFSFMEIALLACGLRARANIEDGDDAGVDGVLVWVLALASGFMSATDAGSVQEGLMRVVTSVVVALLWSRDLLAAKQEIRKAKAGTANPEAVSWRFNVKELGVKLGLATSDGSRISDRDANRRMDRYMRASDLSTELLKLDPEAKNAKTQRAVNRTAKARGRLNRHARLHANPTRLMSVLGERAVDDALRRLGAHPDTDTDTAATPDTGVLAGGHAPEGHAPADTDTAATPDTDTPHGGVVVAADTDGWEDFSADTAALDTRVRSNGHASLAGAFVPSQNRAATVDTGVRADGHGSADTGVRSNGHAPADTADTGVSGAVSTDTGPRSDEALVVRLLAEVPRGDDGTVSVRQVKSVLGVSTARAQRLISAAMLTADPPADPLTDTGEFPAFTAANGFQLND